MQKIGGVVGRTLAKAIAEMQAGHRTRAESLFQTVLRAKPDCVDALYLLGTIRAEDGRLDSAAELLRRAGRLQPDSPYVFNNLGNVHRLRGDLDAAVAAFEQALAIRPELIEAQVNLGLLLRRLGRPGEAEPRLRSVLEQRPAWSTVRLALALALADQQRDAEAIGELHELLAQSPHEAAAHEALALALERSGERDEALRHLERFAELAGGDLAATEAGLLLARLGRAPAPARYPQESMLQTYERKAAGWDRDVARPGMEYLGPQRIAEALGRHLAGARGLRVIDLGCGTGLCAPLLRPLAAHLAGVDLSAPMLRQAEGRGYDELRRADLLDDLAAHPAEYDLAVASGVFILFGDLQPVLAACAGALKPGGSLVFTGYLGEGEALEVRRNLHFAHSRAHLESCAGPAGLELVEFAEAAHEFDFGQPQPGFVAVLRRHAG